MSDFLVQPPGPVDCSRVSRLEKATWITMERDYDLFERLQDNSLVWRGSVHGLENARRKLQELAKRTTNECFATYTPTRQIVALVNIAQAGQLPAKRVVFQIAYDEQQLFTRTELLRQNGYEVVSVVGNEAAKIVLSSPQDCDLFIVGHAAPEQARKEWLIGLRQDTRTLKSSL